MAAFAYRFETVGAQGTAALVGRRVVQLICAGADPAQPQALAQFVPEIGSNLFSLQVEGVEYLYACEARPQAPLLGTPVLYPTPNRVRNAQFAFGGHTFRFPPNNGPHFIHGLVRERPWTCEEPVVTRDSVAVTTRFAFVPGQEAFELFPWRNTLELTYTLQATRLRLDFAVRNEDKRVLPFGLAIHPYFPILGPRESMRLQVPAQKWMEATDLMPSGRLVDLEQAPADLRQPVSLARLNLDDVYWGLVPDKPQVIYYDSLGKQVTLTASAFFTHSVVYTPQGRPFFCVENQSCSTDAHNLYAQDLQEAAHLTLLGPGEALKAWVEIAVSDQ